MLTEVTPNNVVPIDSIVTQKINYGEDQHVAYSSFSVFEDHNSSETPPIHTIRLQSAESMKDEYKRTSDNLKHVRTQLEQLGLTAPDFISKYADAAEYLATDESITELRRLAKVHEEVHSIQEQRFGFLTALHGQVVELDTAIEEAPQLTEIQKIQHAGNLWRRWGNVIIACELQANVEMIRWARTNGIREETLVNFLMYQTATLNRKLTTSPTEETMLSWYGDWAYYYLISDDFEITKRPYFEIDIEQNEEKIRRACIQVPNLAGQIVDKAQDYNYRMYVDTRLQSAVQRLNSFIELQVNTLNRPAQDSLTSLAPGEH